MLKDDVGLIRAMHKDKERIHVGLIELWIDEFLSEAASKNINSTHMRDQSSKGLASYLLDRKSLTDTFRLKPETVDRI